jgi:hypothetical protein
MTIKNFCRRKNLSFLYPAQSAIGQNNPSCKLQFALFFLDWFKWPFFIFSRSADEFVFLAALSLQSGFYLGVQWFPRTFRTINGFWSQVSSQVRKPLADSILVFRGLACSRQIMIVTITDGTFFLHWLKSFWFIPVIHLSTVPFTAVHKLQEYPQGHSVR